LKTWRAREAERRAAADKARREENVRRYHLGLPSLDDEKAATPSYVAPSRRAGFDDELYR